MSQDELLESVKGRLKSPFAELAVSRPAPHAILEKLSQEERDRLALMMVAAMISPEQWIKAQQDHEEELAAAFMLLLPEVFTHLQEAREQAAAPAPAVSQSPVSDPTVAENVIDQTRAAVESLDAASKNDIVQAPTVEALNAASKSFQESVPASTNANNLEVQTQGAVGQEPAKPNANNVEIQTDRLVVPEGPPPPANANSVEVQAGRPVVPEFAPPPANAKSDADVPAPPLSEKQEPTTAYKTQTIVSQHSGGDVHNARNFTRKGAFDSISGTFDNGQNASGAQSYNNAQGLTIAPGATASSVTVANVPATGNAEIAVTYEITPAKPAPPTVAAAVNSATPKAPAHEAPGPIPNAVPQPQTIAAPPAQHLQKSDAVQSSAAIAAPPTTDQKTIAAPPAQAQASLPTAEQGIATPHSYGAASVQESALPAREAAGRQQNLPPSLEKSAPVGQKSVPSSEQNAESHWRVLKSDAPARLSAGVPPELHKLGASDSMHVVGVLSGNEKGLTSRSIEIGLKIGLTRADLFKHNQRMRGVPAHSIARRLPSHGR